MKTITIPYNSALAIIDRALKEARKKSNYIVQEYIDTESKKKEKGLILESIENFDLSKVPKEQHKNLGILGFVNGKEPGDGSIPLEAVFPKSGDELALMYVIQGIYQGDFSQAECKNGVFLKKNKPLKGVFAIIPPIVVKKEDLKKGIYILQ